MAKFVPDVKTKRWVLISPQRVGRPGAEEIGKGSKARLCPFCEGNEKTTPPEVFRTGEGEANKPGWKIRVVPNKYPITDIHEVVIHSPYHDQDVGELSHHEVVSLFKVYRERFNAHAQNGQVIIFCNHGKQAGASLEHPHSQLVVIPSQINMDALALEPANNLVKESEYFLAYCPDFSQWPYEVWFTPKRKNHQMMKFGQITDQEIEDLVRLLQGILRKLNKIFPELYFNYYIYPGENWYLRLIPRLVDRAGFELGTGLSVNIKDPTEAAKELRE